MVERARTEHSTFSSLRDDVISRSLSASSSIYSAPPALRDIVDPQSDTFAVARELFPTDEALHLALRDHLSETFEARAVDKRVLEGSDFSQCLDRYNAALRDFALHHPTQFGAYCSLARTTSLPESFDAELGGVDAGLRILLELVRTEMQKQRSPQEPWLWIAVSTTLYAGFFGIAHLNTFGIANQLLPAGKRQVCLSMVRHLHASSWEVLKTGRTSCPEPYDFARPEKYVVPPAHTLPLDDATSVRFALFRSCMELIQQEGPQALSAQAAAQRIGLQTSDFLPFLDIERPLMVQVEDFLNEAVYGTFMEQAKFLPAEIPPYVHGTMPGVAYATLAMTDPLTFQVLTMIASGSIVPVEFDTKLGDFEMGDALRALFNIVEKNIVLGGGPADPWNLFETTVSLWATVHGIAMLTTSGALSELPRQLRIDLIRAVVDISSSGMVRRLNLDLPRVSDQTHAIKRHNKN